MSSEPPPIVPIVHGHFMADHQQLENDLAQLVAELEVADVATKQALWARFADHAKAHLDAEDDHLLPALLRWNKHVARAFVEEHKLIRRRLTEIGSRLGTAKVRVKDLERFLDELRAHARAEERCLYEWADEHLGQATKDELLAALTG